MTACIGENEEGGGESLSDSLVLLKDIKVKIELCI